jgi:hypothetical protein
MKKSPAKQYYQHIIITLSNGETATFSGQAKIFPDQPTLTITDIKFTEPKELPKDCHFETVGE